MQNPMPGFDDPTSVDELERRWLVADIVRIVTAAPSHCSVRVGLYGTWGSGKTSVLMMVKSAVERAGHAVIELAPWGIASEELLWREFARVVVDGLGKIGVESKQLGKLRRKQKIGSFQERLFKIAQIRSETGAIVDTLKPELEALSRLTAKELKEISELAGGRRIVVLVDDIDRADPRLLQPLLFALREILDVPGFSFVLALDPIVVGEALRDYHPGFSADFLEKIVDFPRHLPKPTPEAILGLARFESERLKISPKLNELGDLLPLLPSNPRQLKAYVRHLWSLDAEFRRHADSELSVPLLLAIQLFRFMHPKSAERIFSSPEALSKMVTPSFGTDDSLSASAPIDLASAVCDSCGINEATPSEAAILAFIIHRSQWLNVAQLRYHGYFAEQPRGLTWREFERIENVWRSDHASLAAVLQEQAAARAHSVDEVRVAVAGAAVKLLGACYESAADAKNENELQGQINRASAALVLVRHLWREHPSVRVLGLFQELLVVALKWSHFTNHEDYRNQRAAEAQALAEMLQLLEPADKTILLGQLIARELGPDFDSQSHSAALCVELRGVAEGAAAALCEDSLMLDGFVHRVLHEEARVGERFLIFDPRSAFWRERRVGVLAHLRSGAATTSIRGNAVEILDAITNPAQYRLLVGQVERAALDGLACDQECVDALWLAASTLPVNPRSFQSLRKLVERLEVASKREIQKPTWWDRIASEVRG